MKFRFLSFSNLFLTIIIVFAIAVFLLFSLSGAITMIKEHRSVKNNFLEYFVITLLSSVSIYLTVLCSISIVIQIKSYIIPYYKGEYQVVSGVVQDFSDEGNLGTIRYNVDNLHFEYAPMDVLYLGINRSGCVKENDNVIIKYVNVEDARIENMASPYVIMEIENLTSKQ